MGCQFRDATGRHCGRNGVAAGWQTRRRGTAVDATEDTDGTLFINRPDNYYGDRMIKAQADANGKFILPDVPDDQPVIFTDADGFLSTSVAEVKRNPNVRLQPWGRVTGILKIAGESKGGVAVDLATLQWFPRMGFNLIYSTVHCAGWELCF